MSFQKQVRWGTWLVCVSCKTYIVYQLSSLLKRGNSNASKIKLLREHHRWKKSGSNGQIAIWLPTHSNGHIFYFFFWAWSWYMWHMLLVGAFPRMVEWVGGWVVVGWIHKAKEASQLPTTTILVQEYHNSGEIFASSDQFVRWRRILSLKNLEENEHDDKDGTSTRMLTRKWKLKGETRLFLALRHFWEALWVWAAPACEYAVSLLAPDVAIAGNGNGPTCFSQ